MSLNYCGDLVRQQDPDRFLISLFAPQGRREALWALFAFNYEIAKTREVVSETATGLIRLQWWRDAIGKIYEGEILEHAVIQDLAKAIQIYDLPKERFEYLIYAREFDVEDRQPETLDGLFKYGELTTAPLNWLALKVLDEDCAQDILTNLSVYYAVTGLLRAVPYHLSGRRMYLPKTLMDNVGLSVSKLYDWKKFEALQPLVKEMIDQIYVRCEVGEMRKHKPKSRYLRAHLALSDLYINQIIQKNFDLFDFKLQNLILFKEFRVWMKTL